MLLITMAREISRSSTRVLISRVLLCRRDQHTTNNSCNSNCSCPEEWFEPVCGADRLTYYSPCDAGCRALFTHTVSTHIFISAPYVVWLDGLCFLSVCVCVRLCLVSGAAIIFLTQLKTTGYDHA